MIIYWKKVERGRGDGSCVSRAGDRGWFSGVTVDGSLSPFNLAVTENRPLSTLVPCPCASLVPASPAYKAYIL